MDASFRLRHQQQQQQIVVSLIALTVPGVGFCMFALVDWGVQKSPARDNDGFVASVDCFRRCFRTVDFHSTD